MFEIDSRCQVESGFLPPRWVLTYPVCDSGGTANGLCKLYGISGENIGPKVYGEMLQEVIHRMTREARCWWNTDHLGTVGAALCWEERKKKASSSCQHATRFQQTSAPHWERELEQLAEHGCSIFGYHA